MLSFKEFILEAWTETDDAAQAMHHAVGTYLKDPKNFKDVLASHHNGMFNISVNHLPLSNKHKNMFPHMHSIKLGRNPGGSFMDPGTVKAYGHAGNSTSPKRRLFGLLPGKQGYHIAVTNMDHLTSKAIQDPANHKNLQKHTVDQWNKSFPIFRHEFEHIKQFHDPKSSGQMVKDANEHMYHDSMSDLKDLDIKSIVANAKAKLKK